MNGSNAPEGNRDDPRDRSTVADPRGPRAIFPNIPRRGRITVNSGGLNDSGDPAESGKLRGTEALPGMFRLERSSRTSFTEEPSRGLATG